ncbi:MAG: AmmeMemoRadiSam system protein A [bacterium]
MFKKKRRNVLSEEEQIYILDFARKSIEAKIRGADPPRFEADYSNLKAQRGAFVTLYNRGNLRGCIGTISSTKPLYETIQEVAQAAAFQDPRFQPLSESELSKISIEISVLTPLKKIKNFKRIKIGRHGIFVKSGEAHGLLLPQVAVNNHWDRKTFLQHTCIKAGLPKDAWQKDDTEIMIFGAQVFEEESHEEATSE